MEWQPIETAPRDGRRILLNRRRHGVDRVELGKWMIFARSAMFCYDFPYHMNSVTKIQPTHWMPLPDAPRGQ